MTMKISVRETLISFERSAEYRRLQPNTRLFYTYGSQAVLAALGTRRLESLRRADIIELRDAQETPAQANRALSTIKRLLTWGLDHGLVGQNVALRVPSLPLEGRHCAWPEDALEVMAEHSHGIIRKLFLLCLHSAQRRGDCLAARWADVCGGRWRLTQQKTGRAMSIPLTDALIDALQPGKPQDRLISDALYPNPSLGQVTYLWNRTREALDLQGYTLHGLRVTRATQLAQAGCSPHEIAALTGHKSLKMVEAYTVEVSQERLVDQAIAKLQPQSVSIRNRQAQDFSGANIIRNNP